MHKTCWMRKDRNNKLLLRRRNLLLDNRRGRLHNKPLIKLISTINNKHSIRQGNPILGNHKEV